MDINSDIITGYDLMATKHSIDNAIQQEVNMLSESDIKEIYKSHDGLNPRNSKKESRKEWVDKYKDRQAQITKWSQWCENTILKVQNQTSAKKADVREALSDELRERQKNLGFDTSLINPVKISLLGTFVSYLNNPSKLNQSPAYQPRGSGNGKSSKSTILSSNNFDIKISSRKNSEIIGSLFNSNDYPLQTLTLEVLKSDGLNLSISGANGENFNATNNKIHISFMKGSMAGTTKRVDFKISINDFYDFNQGYSIKVTAEDPAINDVVSKLFEFDD